MSLRDPDRLTDEKKFRTETIDVFRFRGAGLASSIPIVHSLQAGLAIDALRC